MFKKIQLYIDVIYTWINYENKIKCKNIDSK